MPLCRLGALSVFFLFVHFYLPTTFAQTLSDSAFNPKPYTELERNAYASSGVRSLKKTYYQRGKRAFFCLPYAKTKANLSDSGLVEQILSQVVQHDRYGAVDNGDDWFSKIVYKVRYRFSKSSKLTVEESEINQQQISTTTTLTRSQGVDYETYYQEREEFNYDTTRKLLQTNCSKKRIGPIDSSYTILPKISQENYSYNRDGKLIGKYSKKDDDIEITETWDYDVWGRMNKANLHHIWEEEDNSIWAQYKIEWQWYYDAQQRIVSTTVNYSHQSPDTVYMDKNSSETFYSKSLLPRKIVHDDGMVIRYKVKRNGLYKKVVTREGWRRVLVAKYHYRKRRQYPIAKWKQKHFGHVIAK